MNSTNTVGETIKVGAGMTQCNFTGYGSINPYFNATVTSVGSDFQSATVSVKLTTEIVGPAVNITLDQAITNPAFIMTIPSNVNQTKKTLNIVFEGANSSYTHIIYGAMDCAANASFTSKELSSHGTGKFDVTKLAANTTKMISVQLVGSFGNATKILMYTEFDKSSSNTAMIVGITIAVVAVLGIGGYCFWQRRQRSGYEPLLGDAK